MFPTSFADWQLCTQCVRTLPCCSPSDDAHNNSIPNRPLDRTYGGHIVTIGEEENHSDLVSSFAYHIEVVQGALRAKVVGAIFEDVGHCGAATGDVVAVGRCGPVRNKFALFCCGKLLRSVKNENNDDDE